MNARPNDPALLAAPASSTSLFEEKYHAFSPELVEAARAAKIDLTPQLEQLNKISALCYGMAVVARIVAGNPVVADVHNASDPDSAAPLSNCAISHLNNMLAELCHHIADDICLSADHLNAKVAA